VFADTKKSEPAKAGKKKEATVETSDKDDKDFLDL
jgi:hypothetical protein